MTSARSPVGCEHLIHDYKRERLSTSTHYHSRGLDLSTGRSGVIPYSVCDLQPSTDSSRLMDGDPVDVSQAEWWQIKVPNLTCHHSA